MIGKKFLSVFHLVALLILIAWTYIGQSGSLPYSMGEISEKYPTLFTPANYAFAIWGVIFLGLLVFASYQIYCAFKRDKEDEFIARAVFLMSLAYIFTTFWVWFWGNDMIATALAFMILIFLCLLAVVFRLRMELWDAPVHFMAAVWWPIDLLFGWINVALIANVAVYLKSTGWDGWGLEAESWTLIMIATVGILGLVLIAARNMREVAAVFIWALIAIAVRQWDQLPTISYCSIGIAITLATFSSIHAFQNRATLPHNKLKKGEW